MYPILFIHYILCGGNFPIFFFLYLYLTGPFSDSMVPMIHVIVPQIHVYQYLLLGIQCHLSTQFKGIFLYSMLLGVRYARNWELSNLTLTMLVQRNLIRLKASLMLGCIYLLCQHSVHLYYTL